MATDVNYDVSLKLVVIGESGVGKSNLLLWFRENRFDEELMPTVGLDFSSEDFNIKDKKVKVQIWDTAGQEKYRSTAKTYYRLANTILLVYDVTNRSSFEKLKEWI